VRATPGARYVDLYRGTSVDGRFSQYLQVDGRRVDARQSDGIHFTLDGAVVPAQLALDLVEREYGALH
ncbi:MAG: hypothetical protein WAN48_02150, partial [Actinomycetes bacterium]